MMYAYDIDEQDDAGYGWVTMWPAWLVPYYLTTTLGFRC